MIFFELDPPVIDLPEHTVWHRVQRTRALKASVRLCGHVLPPKGLLTGRFDLVDESASYLADSEETSLYEAVFRREVQSYPLARLKERSLAAFETRHRPRVANVRGLEEQHPVLQSARYVHTRAFAAECRSNGLDGVLYASAQHPSHACLCVFESGIRKLRRKSTIRLIEPDTDRWHRAVERACRGSGVPVDP